MIYYARAANWVRHKTMVVLSLQSLLTRLTGQPALPARRLRQLTSDVVAHTRASFPNRCSQS